MNQSAPTTASLPLPLAIEDITPQWLTQSLASRYPGVVVEHSEIVDIISGTCTKVRLKLTVNRAGQEAGIPETVILKGGFEPHSREMFGTHEKEVRAYRDLFPEFKLHSPTCYFADFDAERLQGIVIIEDLVARGVSFCHPQKPQSHGEVARRLRSLAAFHARSWNSPELAPGGRWSWAPDYLASMQVYMARYLEPETWNDYAGLPRGAAASVKFHDPAWMKQAIDIAARVGESLPRCMLHGDTHLGNLYVDPDGTPGYFDPQCLVAPAMVEVTYHVAGALDPADRRHWEGSLIQHYIDELQRHGVAGPRFEDALEQYALFLPLGYCIFLVNAAEFQPEAINTAYTARFSAAMIDQGTLEKLRALEG